MKWILALVLSLCLGWPSCKLPQPVPTKRPTAIVQTDFEKQHVNTHRLFIYDMSGPAGFKVAEGGCSGTIVGPHAILTAQHCFLNTNLVRLDEEIQPTVISSALLDGNDHVIYTVNRTFEQWSGMDENVLTVGTKVHYWGNPGQPSVYGEGYLKELAPFPDLDPTFVFQHFTMRVLHGDSGSGLFNDAGQIVAVISMGDTRANEYSLPLAFTQHQLEQAGK